MRSSGLALTAAMVVVAVGPTMTAASADPVPRPGTWSVASAEWIYRDGQGVLRALDIDVTEHRTPTGEVKTEASVFRSICHASGDAVSCGGDGPTVRHVHFVHDALMSQAQVAIRLAVGGVVRASWQSHNSLPSGLRSDQEQCIPSNDPGSADYSLMRDASISAQAFGHHWGSRHLATSYLAFGAGTKPPC